MAYDYHVFYSKDDYKTNQFSKGF